MTENVCDLKESCDTAKPCLARVRLKKGVVKTGAILFESFVQQEPRFQFIFLQTNRSRRVLDHPPDLQSELINMRQIKASIFVLAQPGQKLVVSFRVKMELAR